MDDALNKRRSRFAGYVDSISNGSTQGSQPDARYPCPCCGYPTLHERGGYEICELCNWEDDGQDDPHADEVWGGPNGEYSLSAARRNFVQHLIMYDPNVPEMRIGGGDSELERDAKEAIVASFDSLIGQSDPMRISSLRDVIRANELILKQELNRKVREHEQRLRESRQSRPK